MRPFYIKLILYASLPFILLIVCNVVWGVIQIRDRDKSLVRVKTIASIVILLFFFHPSIVNYVFNTFK